MTNKHKFIILLIAMIALSACSAGRAQSSDVEQVQLINPLGPVVIPLAGITSGEIETDITINVQYWKSIDEAVGLLADEQTQFAVLPITAGANLAASGLDLVLAGVHEWKVFYLVAAPDAEFEDWNSLIGESVYSPESKGQTVDVLTRYALSKAGIQPDDDVEFVYAPPQEIVALFKEGKIKFAALPEPFVTLALSGTDGRIVLDYQEFWAAESGSEYGIPIAGLFVQRAFLDKYPEIVEIVADALQLSTDWANDNPQKAVLASSEVLPLPVEVMQASLQRILFTYIPAQDCKSIVLDFLTSMQNTYPEGIKAIPGEGFFMP